MARLKARARAREATDHSLSIEESKLRLLGVALLAAKVALVPLIFDPSLDVPFVVPKALVSHALAYLLLAVLGALFVRHGLSFIVRSWLHIPVVAYVLVSAAASVVAANITLALFGTHARMLGLVSIVDGAILYFAIVLLIRTRANAVAIGLSALAGSTIVLAYEAIQVLGQDPFQWSGVAIAPDGTVRPFSTLGHATVLAEYLTVLAVGVFALAVALDRVTLATRVALLAYSLLLLLGTAATSTRSSLLGIAGGTGVLVLLVWIGHPNKRARPIALVGAAGAVLALIALLVFSPVGARFAASINRTADDSDLASQLEPSAGGRVALYEVGLALIRERPILGYGPDNFVVGVPIHRPERANEVVRQNLPTSTHSWLIQVATSSGVVGLACFLGVMAVAGVLTLRTAFHPGTVVGAAMLGAFLASGITTVNETGTDWLFWLSAGAVAVSAARSRSAPVLPARSRGARRRTTPLSAKILLMGSMIAALALVGGAASLGALEGSRMAGASKVSRLEGRSTSAVDFALRATQADPRRAEYWDVLGLAYISASRWKDATAAFERASLLAPYNASYISDLASAQLLLMASGDVPARARAREAGDRAVRIDPNNPRPHLTRAVVMHTLGYFSEAARSVERAMYLDPSSTNTQLYVTGIDVMLSAGHPSDAIKVGRDGVAVLGQRGESVPIRVALARALYASGKPVDALAELDVALAMQPNDQSAQHLRTEIRASLPK